MSRFVAMLSLMATVAGCASVISSEEAGEPPFPECRADSYLFVGQASLAALGLESMWQEEAARSGEIWVTAEPVEQEPIPGEPALPAERMICLEFGDGSGMSGPVPEGWELPGTGFDLDRAAGAAVPGIVLIAAVALVTVISVLAFRIGAKGERDG